MILIFARTPLQLFIVRELISQKIISGEISLIYTAQNKKNDYLSIIRGYEFKNIIVIKDITWSSRLNKLIQINILRKAIKSLSFEQIVISSIDYLPFRYAISERYPIEIISYDDGLGNYKENSIYFSESDDWFERVISKQLKILSLAQLKTDTKVHYTILDNYKVHSHSRYTQLKSVDLKQVSRMTNNVSIFIGQEWCDYITDDDKDFVSRLVDILSINPVTFYIPHPKEKDLMIGKLIAKNVVYINSICEEFIYTLVTSGVKKITVYTVMSTTALLLSSISSIEVIVIVNKNDKYSEYHATLRQLYLQSGCAFLEI